MTKHSITQEELKQQLHYNPDNGIFTWVKSWRSDFIGKQAGCLNKFGYVFIKTNGVIYKGHRLAWLYMTGNWPKEHIDHINGVKYDNRWCNLRECTNAENMRNTKKPSNNTSGFKGVDFDKKRNKWRVRCKVGDKRHFLGLFETPDLASKAYECFAKINFGEFYRG